MRVLIVAAVVAATATAGHAGYQDGYTDGAYTYTGGYWWNAGKAYTREWVATTTYGPHIVNGYYYASWPSHSGYYQYTYHHDKPAVSHADPNWKAKLLDIAAARDKVELDIRKGTVEYAHFRDAVGALGLTGNFHINGYGQHVQYPPGYTGSPFALGYHGIQGNTVYGYNTQSTATTADLYGSTDLNVLYQQSAKLAQGAQGLADQGQSGFQSLVQAAGDNKARVAEILARGEAMRQVLAAPVGPPTAKVTTQTTSTTSNAGASAVPPGVMPLAAGTLRDRAAKCVACHGKTDNHGFDVSTYAGLDAAGKLKVHARLVHPDPNKRMPLDAGGGPGVPLTADELRQWFAD